MCSQCATDSQRLVLQDSSEIYALDIQSGEALNLTHHPAKDEIPYYTADQTISPDGQFLALTSTRDHWRKEVYVLHIASGEVVARLTANFVTEWAPAWRPR